MFNPWKRNRELQAKVAELTQTNEILSQAIMEREERITAQYRVQLQNLEDEIDGLKALLDQAAVQLRNYTQLRECVHDIALSCSNSTSGTALRVSRQMMEAIQ